MREADAASLHLFWRAYVPRWAHEPLSGEGARRFGGRWNPVGAPTIHAARELSTAWAEYNQGFVQHPALIIQIELSGASLADLTELSVLRTFDATPEIHKCEWRADLDRGAVPPTHKLREYLIAQDYDGVIYPSSISRGGSCVAIWRWNTPGAPSLRAIDPEHLLPHNQQSWTDK
jgi:RES domain-containing protein